MSFIKKYNTWIFITIVAVLTIADIIFWNSLSLTRKIITVFAVLAALHEIEEKVWPGGFYDLMLKKFRMTPDEVDLGRGTLVVSIYWLLLLGSAYIFDSRLYLLAAIIVLAFFEAVIHTAGIRIHHLKKPYTPGLLTAWCLAIAGGFAVHSLNKAGSISRGDYALGFVVWLVSFACMDIVIISGFGKPIPELIKTVTGKK